MAELERLFEYYVAHQDELVSQYEGRWIVLAGDGVVANFGSEIEAYGYATENLTPGAFMLQFVAPGAENYSQTFHSRVAI